jgi:hypothetical protein
MVLTRHNLVRLLILGLVLALLVVSFVGVATNFLNITAPNFLLSLFQGEGAGAGPAAVIACSCGDPGGSQGGCC